MATVDVVAGDLPEEFGKYAILDHLATGGMAEVYIARQAGLEGFEKIVVIKRIRPELTDDAAMMRHFLDEARLVATLEHPSIAQVYEIGLVNGSYFFVMEYVHGADLRRVMNAALRKHRTVPLADAVYIVSHVCAALHYAHEKKALDGTPLEIIHRDVSPSNVLLSHDGAVKVCDFGIAKAHNQTHETQRGTVKGKYAYMSPEQCRCEPVDRRSDVFAIGVILYELTTLTRLFKADSDYELLRMVVEQPVPPPSTRVSGYPPELERIVMKALAKHPDDRYATAQDMQLDIEAFAREQKLAMSSVNIATLMSELFEKKVEAWMRAHRKMTGETTPFTRDSDLAIPIEGRPSQRALAAGTPLRTPVTPLPPARPSRWWLAGIVAAGLAAGGVTLAGRTLHAGDTRAATQALDADVDKIASALDTTVRGARMRADSLATTPVLRAAITRRSSSAIASSRSSPGREVARR
jgi:serine/threonine protein kinase